MAGIRGGRGDVVISTTGGAGVPAAGHGVQDPQRAQRTQLEHGVDEYGDGGQCAERVWHGVVDAEELFDGERDEGATTDGADDDAGGVRVGRGATSGGLDASPLELGGVTGFFLLRPFWQVDDE